MHERLIKINIITALMLIIISPKLVKAEESINITENIKIKYKWYIEEKVDETYLPKGSQLTEYLENPYDVKYGKYSNWSYDLCSSSREKYIVDENTERIYKKVQAARYIKIVNLSNPNVVRVFINLYEIPSEKKLVSNDTVIIDLKNMVDIENIQIYIDTLGEYDIYMSSSEAILALSVYKHVVNERLIKPDKTWITDKTTYAVDYLHENVPENEFRKFTGFRTSCRIKEILTYHYKLKKKYYDNNYHEYIEGYIPDTSDYIVEYTGELPERIINITKTVKEITPIKEYIYLENDNSTKDNDSKNENKVTEQPQKQITKTKYIEKKITEKEKYIPLKIYIILALLVIANIIQAIKRMRKKSSKTID